MSSGDDKSKDMEARETKEAGDGEESNGNVTGVDDKLVELQKDVDETAALMKDNIEKIVDRGEKLEVLEVKTDDLEASSSSFKKTAVKMGMKYYWKNMKVKLCIIGTIVAVILIIILIILLVTQPWDGGDGNDGSFVASSTTSATKTTTVPSSMTPNVMSVQPTVADGK